MKKVLGNLFAPEYAAARGQRDSMLALGRTVRLPLSCSRSSLSPVFKTRLAVYRKGWESAGKERGCQCQIRTL